ncbi:MAG: hypothetical protein L0I24_22085, partial [Pseudonocardia sp.]|nr:hypothetical protein [Pseudonocardia sp.]
RLVAEDHAHLLDEARALGLDDTRARAVLAAVAAELGAPIEAPDGPTEAPAPTRGPAPPVREWEGPLKAARAALRAGRAAEAQRLVRQAQRVAGPDGATPVRAVADEIAAVLDDAARRWAAVGAAGRRVAEALEQSRKALAELRALSRGIAPPILADRGLGAALAAAAARCPVPVTLDVSLPDGVRMPAAVENTAYFVVTESLTNVAKHARASQCAVVVGADGDRLLVQVRDNGGGGAHPGKGHGLAGLADRLAAVEGVLDLVSPAGGPTVLTAEIPLVGV